MLRIPVAALAAFFVSAAAFAQAPDELPALVMQAQTAPVTPVVTIPWGDWLGSFLAPLQQIIATVLLAAATALVAMLPAWIQELVRPWFLTKRVDQLFENAAKTAVSGVAGSTRGKEVGLVVANDLVRSMLLIVVQQGAPAVIEFAGKTARALAEKAIARLGDKVVLPEHYTVAQATAEAAKVLAATEADRP